MPDTAVQKVSRFKGKSYKPPCKISSNAFHIIEAGLTALGAKSKFRLTYSPAYQLFDNILFKGQRSKFWKPMLKSQYPIYIVSPLFGILWPGDGIGPYDLAMEEVCVAWRQQQLWRVVLELFGRNKCDCVLSYLPSVYDNVVRVEETPWFIFEPEQLLEHQQLLLKIASTGA